MSTSGRGVKRKSKAEAPSVQLTAKQRQEIKEAFNLIDIDEIGEVDRASVPVALKALGLVASPQYLADLDEEVTLKAFIAFVTPLICRQETGIDAANAFLLIDGNGSGAIEIEDLKKIAADMMENWTADQLQAMLDEADASGKGKVTLDDFKQLLQRAGLA